MRKIFLKLIRQKMYCTNWTFTIDTPPKCCLKDIYKEIIIYSNNKQTDFFNDPMMLNKITPFINKNVWFKGF